MLTSKPNLSKNFEFQQDDKTYKIELFKNINNIIFSIKDINEINEYYKLEISFEDIQKKNIAFRIYNIDELINTIEQFILNKNISFKINNNDLILNLYF